MEWSIILFGVKWLSDHISELFGSLFGLIAVWYAFFRSLNIFIAHIFYMQGIVLQVISTLYTPSPQVSTKQCHDNKQMNMSYEYIQWIDMIDYNHK